MAAVSRKAWSLSIGSLYVVAVGMLIIISCVYYPDARLSRDWRAEQSSNSGFP